MSTNGTQPMSLRSMLGDTPAPGAAPPQAPESAPSPQAPAAGQSVAPPSTQPATQPVTAEQQESQIISAFTKRGFERPAGMSEDQFLDAIAAQIDQANRVLDQSRQQPAPGPTSTAPRPASQPSAPTNTPSGQPATTGGYNSAPNSVRPDTANNENALPAQPAMGESSPAAGAPLRLSETAQFLAQHGQVYQDSNGSWTASTPDFQKFADEHNNVAAHRRIQALRLIDNPDEYLSPIIESHTKAYIDKLQETVTALEAQLSTRAQQEQMTALEQRVEGWLAEKKAHLFQGEDSATLTQAGERFNRIAAKYEAEAISKGEDPDPIKIKMQTIEMMELLGDSAAETAPTPEPQPASPPQPRQSFLQQAANAPARNPHNRLTEIHAAQQPSNEPRIPLGPGKVPSLRALIESQSN